MSCSLLAGSKPAATTGSTPRLNFPYPFELSLSRVRPPFLEREQDGRGRNSRLIVASSVITGHKFLMPQKLLPWVPPPPHATSSSSVLIFTALNGCGPFLLPVIFVISLASRSGYPITCIASVTFTFVAGFAWHGSHQPFIPSFSKTY